MNPLAKSGADKSPFQIVFPVKRTEFEGIGDSSPDKGEVVCNISCLDQIVGQLAKFCDQTGQIIDVARFGTGAQRNGLEKNGPKNPSRDCVWKNPERISSDGVFFFFVGNGWNDFQGGLDWVGQRNFPSKRAHHPLRFKRVLGRCPALDGLGG
ncbi:hypothetical protein [Zavarzinella formosa]|uniref:hypothetical protein n=1 Tax=Zavarzinella formosa TaxID=360055 RepID=UPI0012F797B3|nr:hypothetical protein [Zavarzinella formosa]